MRVASEALTERGRQHEDDRSASAPIPLLQAGSHFAAHGPCANHREAGLSRSPVSIVSQPVEAPPCTRPSPVDSACLKA